MADTYLSRTPSSAGNRRTWTVSFWVKRSDIGASFSYIFDCDNGASQSETAITFDDDKLRFSAWNGSSDDFFIETSQVFRDSSAWYHVVYGVDTTQATASNRVKIYVNGQQVTSFDTATYPTQNYDTGINTTSPHAIGRWQDGASRYFGGYLAHFHLTDGTQYAASDFGETDTNGQWSPKPAPSVTYGTNGFFLKFANSGSLGTDSSGNGNNFTKNGSGDQVTDTPDNVFATFNPLIINRWANAGTPTKGNTEISWTSGDADTGIEFSTLGVPSGKWYWEVKMPVVARAMVGVGYMQDIVKNTNVFYDNNPSNGFALAYNGNLNYDATNTTYGSSFSNNDIVQVALDMDNHLCWFGLNGTWQNSATQTEIENSTATNDATTKMGTQQNLNSGAPVFPFVIDPSTTGQAQFQINFGNPPFSITSGNTDDNGYGNFEYAPPSGYLALCTRNLSTEVTLPIDDGSDYFKTVTYTGNAPSSQTITTGLRPDMVWTKNRTNIADHNLYDTNRGDGLKMKPNQPEAEADVGTDFQFGTTGFTVGNRSETNDGSAAMVSWNWNVNNGSTSSNSDGSITSTVQVNTTAGISIATYTGDGSGTATVGHGLGVAPGLVYARVRNVATHGRVWTSGLSGAGYYLILDQNNTENNSEPIFNGAPTSTVVGFGSDFTGNGNNYIVYSFAEKEGYSKFGRYTGNGNNDGTFVYTGFRPALIIQKCLSITEQWQMHDTVMNPYNLSDKFLFPNLSNAQATSTGGNMDIYSNGFKMRSSDPALNGNGTNYIYLAWAENPFVDSTGRPATAR